MRYSFSEPLGRKLAKSSTKKYSGHFIEKNFLRGENELGSFRKSEKMLS